MLFPTFGRTTAEGGRWEVGISGVVYDHTEMRLRRRVMKRALRRFLGLTATQLDTQLFRRRLEPFVMSTSGGRWLRVQAAGSEHLLSRPSRRNGQFRGTLSIVPPQKLGNADSLSATDGWLAVRVKDAEISDEWSQGAAQLLPPRGISVISDIDDTVKQSHVADRRELLRHTFLLPFEAVPGMPELYHRWAGQGIAFHYVSSSPWQLYPSLSEFFHRVGLPRGSFHLRSLRIRDARVLRRFVTRRALKYRVVHAIVRTFPERQFVLIGDTGELDPELYGAIARDFPRQIVRVFLREAAGRSISTDRLAQAFDGVPRRRWSVFQAADELPNVIQPDV